LRQEPNQDRVITMDDILADFSASALAKAIEGNQHAYLMDLRRSPLVSLHQEPELMWFLTGDPLPGFNRVVHACFEADDVDVKIGGALAPFKGRDLPMQWHIGPSTRPSDLGERLVAQGLRHVSDEPGMASDLLALDHDPKLPRRLRVERVRDSEALKKWCQTAEVAFNFSKGVGDARARIETSLGPGRLPARRLYLGRIGSQPVATALLFLGVGVAGLYDVGVLPDKRRQGVGRTMTLVPLLEARAEGYRIGTLHSSPMGLGIYQKLGFQEYCTLSRYTWRPE
jgi:GNAT superfamily N-acetyltransferase